MGQKCFAIMVDKSITPRIKKMLLDGIFNNWALRGSYEGGTQLVVYADSGPITKEDGQKYLVWNNGEVAVGYVIKPYGFWPD